MDHPRASVLTILLLSVPLSVRITCFPATSRFMTSHVSSDDFRVYLLNGECHRDSTDSHVASNDDLTEAKPLETGRVISTHCNQYKSAWTS